MDSPTTAGKTPAADACVCVQLDRRVEYGRAIAARTRISIAIEALATALSETSVTVGNQHIATGAIAVALQDARIAGAKLDIAIKVLGRIK